MSDFQTVPGSPQIFMEVPQGLSQEGCCDRESVSYMEQTGLIPLIPTSMGINVLVKLFLTLSHF